jgi:hypothetical protein
MKGFKEALLTKVLCIVYPDRFLTILMYTGLAGKREIARSLWGLDLPDPQKVDWTIGATHHLEQRPAAGTSRRRLRAQAARRGIPVVGQRQGLRRAAPPPDR